jgi:hypothetical protein
MGHLPDADGLDGNVGIVPLCTCDSTAESAPETALAARRRHSSRSVSVNAPNSRPVVVPSIPLSFECVGGIGQGKVPSALRTSSGTRGARKYERGPFGLADSEAGCGWRREPHALQNADPAELTCVQAGQLPCVASSIPCSHYQSCANDCEVIIVVRRRKGECVAIRMGVDLLETPVTPGDERNVVTPRLQHRDASGNLREGAFQGRP